MLLVFFSVVAVLGRRWDSTSRYLAQFCQEGRPDGAHMPCGLLWKEVSCYKGGARPKSDRGVLWLFRGNYWTTIPRRCSSPRRAIIFTSFTIMGPSGGIQDRRSLGGSCWTTTLRPSRSPRRTMSSTTSTIMAASGGHPDRHSWDSGSQSSSCRMWQSIRTCCRMERYCSGDGGTSLQDR
jgi:hypothetical protein